MRQRLTRVGPCVARVVPAAGHGYEPRIQEGARSRFSSKLRPPRLVERLGDDAVLLSVSARVTPCPVRETRA